MTVSMTWPQHQRREVKVLEKVIKLSPMEHLITSVLLMRRNIVKAIELVEILYPNANLEPDYAENSVRIFVQRARRKGVPIKTRKTFGYEFLS